MFLFGSVFQRRDGGQARFVWPVLLDYTRSITSAHDSNPSGAHVFLVLQRPLSIVEADRWVGMGVGIVPEGYPNSKL